MRGRKETSLPQSYSKKTGTTQTAVPCCVTDQCNIQQNAKA